MTGIEPGSSGIVSNRSANCATTTSPYYCKRMNQRTLTVGGRITVQLFDKTGLDQGIKYVAFECGEAAESKM